MSRLRPSGNGPDAAPEKRQTGRPVAVKADSQATPVKRREEVRLAMGWNGGVSLAVWMGGVAAELDDARRAHLSVDEDVKPASVKPARRVYNTVCDAFDRQLVLDIFAGARADGLNSAHLGAAIYKRRRLHRDFLRTRWLALGDFSRLLQPTNKAKPTSIIQELFATSMLEAFTELMNPAKNPTPDKPDLAALPPNSHACPRPGATRRVLPAPFRKAFPL
jgi:hypothetical protein